MVKKMSSTKRGYNRHKLDYYITPVSEIVKFIENLNEKEVNFFENKVLLDPCCGGDYENQPSYPEAFRSLSLVNELYTIDIREDSKATYKEDYLTFDIKRIQKEIDIIITNPPFYLAINIIKKALSDVKEGGYVIMLLRLNFFGSDKRNEWLRNNMPKFCFIHAKRMSFVKSGGTDSIEYAHFVWQKENFKNYTKTYLLKY